MVSLPMSEYYCFIQTFKTRHFLLAQSSSHIIHLYIIRPVWKQEAGLHIPCELLQVDVDAVMIKECLVDVIERLEEINIRQVPPAGALLSPMRLAIRDDMDYIS